MGGGLQEDPILAITLFSCGVSLVWIGQGMHTLRICGVPALSYFRVFFREALKTAPFVIVMAGTRYLTDNLLLIIATFFICLGVLAVLFPYMQSDRHSE